ncbi:MAG: hypothetical protein HON48_12210 [Desulfobacula sp.]|nr:hypothetical protein [Desulfobacula sp.]
MDKLTINRIRYKNFKGLADYTLEPNGKDISVFGQNATGKTTLIDGVSYLLFGKDSYGRADFQLKPVDKDGQEIHNLETEVEGVFDVNNKTITLRKRFQEKYTKKRGEPRQTFTGHTTDYFIDDVPAKKKEYDIKISEIIDVNAFKLVTNPLEFNNLHWTGRRQILLEMCGDVTDLDVIDSDKKLKSLSEILGDCSIDDHKKKIQAKKREINKELEQIPVRIAENQETAKDAMQPDYREKTRLEKVLEEKKEKLRSLRSNEALSSKKVRLNEVDSKILVSRNEADQKQADLKKPILQAIEKLEAERRDLTGKIKDNEFRIFQDEKRNKVSEDAIVKIREDWHIENNKQPSNDNTCPTCGQDLPKDIVKNTIGMFNRLKSDRLTMITATGKEMAANIEQRNKDIEAAKVEIAKLTDMIAGVDEIIARKKAEFEKVYVGVDIDDLDRQKDVLEQEIDALLNGSVVQEENTQREIFESQEKFDELNQLEASWKAAESCRIRISELEAQEKELAAEFERLEAEIFLIEKFIIKKVEMLEGQINSRFKLARFKLFETQINEGIKECCDVLYNGVPYNHGLNSGARINVGLDIIQTLSEYYGFQAPVFVDNRESINNLFPISSQVISLVVSNDKALSILKTETQKAS